MESKNNLQSHVWDTNTKSIPIILIHWRQDHSKVSACSCNNVPEAYKCGNCNFETNLKVSLTQHFNQNHQNLKNHYQFRTVLRQCGYCNFQTYSTLLLLKHCLQCPKRESCGTEEPHKIINWLECGQCSYKTQITGNIRNWFECTHKQSTSRDCSRTHTFNRNTLSFSKKWLNAVPFNKKCLKCDKCPYEAKSSTGLRRHVNYHHRENLQWFQCQKCEYKTKRSDHLKQHITSIHTDSANIVWYRCDQCEYSAKRKDQLKRHVANIHTWYPCARCELKCKRKSDLEQHVVKMHSGSVNNV